MQNRNPVTDDAMGVTAYNNPYLEPQNPVTDDDYPVSPSSGNVYEIIDMDMLSTQRRVKGMSYQKIADASGVSEPTVRKFFNGQNKNPSFYNVYSITEQLGVSLDALVHRSSFEPDQPGSTKIYYEEIIRIKDDQIADLEKRRDIARERYDADKDAIRKRAALQYEEQNAIIRDLNHTVESHAEYLRKSGAEIDDLQNRNRIKNWIIGIGVGLVVVAFVADVLLGNIGWIRYDGGLQQIIFG